MGSDRVSDAIAEHGADILASEGMLRCAELSQHGSTSVRDHCVAVAACALRLARAWRLRVDERVLVRGALLHDYFLYDWHDRASSRPRHATMHPRYAAENAERDFGADEDVRRVVLSHMFPLPPTRPPRSAEAWLVCLADKGCTVAEVVRDVPARLARAARPEGGVSR